VIGVWVENWLRLELLTSELAKGYLEFTKPQNVEAFFPEELVTAIMSLEYKYYFFLL
jgi:hypothetical protein